MDFIKSQVDRVQQQLSGLTASQKMLSAALVVIMVMALWSWGNYAAKPDMVPVLDQTMAADEVARIDTQLTASGIDHVVENSSRILVPAERKLEAVAALGYASVLPKNMSSGFEEMIKQMTPWDGQSRQDALFNHGKEVTLQRIMSLYPGVAGANVILDPTFKRHIGQNVQPTAAVSLTMREGSTGNKQLARACAQLVSGAQAGLDMAQVRVTIDGRPFTVVDAMGAVDGTSWIEIQQAAERSLSEKLQTHLDWIQGVRVSVTVKVEGSSVAAESTEVDKDKSYIGEEQITESKREETTTQAPSGEAGVVPNAGLEVNPAATAAPLHSSTETESTIKNINVPAITKKTVQTPAGQHTPVAASVRVPRSYFVMVAKNGDLAAKEPDAAELQKAIDRELPQIASATAACTGIQQPEAISVEMFTDFAAPQSVEPQLAAASSVTMMLGGHVKEIALGALAAFSLFMMSMIVRKGTPAALVVPVAAPRASAATVLSGAESFAGEVTEQKPALDGMELDEDSIKTQQMLSQVTDMVGENPESAAQLIKRWMNQR